MEHGLVPQTVETFSCTKTVIKPKPLVTSGSNTKKCNDVSAGCAVKDYGNLTFEEVVEEAVGGVRSVRAVGSANWRLSEVVQNVKRDGHTSVLLGGDHR